MGQPEVRIREQHLAMVGVERVSARGDIGRIGRRRGRRGRRAALRVHRGDRKQHRAGGGGDPDMKLAHPDSPEWKLSPPSLARAVDNVHREMRFSRS